MHAPESAEHDVVIVGGGLSGCLVALAINSIAPDCDFILIEATDRLGGQAILPFFLDDVLPAERALLLDDILVAEWPRYYLSLESECTTEVGWIGRLDPLQLHADMISRIPPSKILAGVEATHVAENCVTSNAGQHRTRMAIDARPQTVSDTYTAQISTFNVLFDNEHPLRFPILVDEPIRTSAGRTYMQYIPLTANEVTVRSLGYGSAEAHPSFVAHAIDRDVRLERFGAKDRWVSSDGAWLLPRHVAHPLLPSPVPAASAAACWIADLVRRQSLRPDHFAVLASVIDRRFPILDSADALLGND